MKLPISNPYLLTEPEFRAWSDGYESLPSIVNPHRQDSLSLAWKQGQEARLADIKDIPQGHYCYSRDDQGGRTCPYWYLMLDSEGHRIGCCSFLGENDAQEGASGLLWDHVKSCSENYCWGDDVD